MFTLILVAINVATVIAGAFGERKPETDDNGDIPCS
jgi:hypothetical protein